MMNCPEDVLDFCPHALQGNSAFVFTALVNALFSAKCGMDPRKDFKEDFGEYFHKENVFDFIVVGGGTSGCVVANRLSENPNWTVLLLEAGGYPNAESEIPLFHNDLLRTRLDWNFKTVHLNDTCSGFKGGTCMWSKGKVLGGTSTINDMVYLPGIKEDFDAWNKLGIKGWDWEEVSEYYAKAGRMLEPTTPHSVYKIRNTLTSAAKDLGYTVNSGPSGFHDAPVTIEHARRYSSAKAYLSGIKYRNNLFVMTKALVARVLISNSGRATGVTIGWDEEFINITASMEVVLSAGSINSAKVLMLSGVGPRNHLKKVNIRPIIPSPVGNHLQDQLGAFGVFVKLDSNISDDVKIDLDDIYQYFTSRTGTLSNIGLTNFLWQFSTLGDQIPNIKVQHYLYPQNDGHSLRTNTHALSFNKDSTLSLRNTNKRSALLHLIITLLKPGSTGKIRLTSNNPYKDPIIYPRYFTCENDMRTLLDALKEIKRFVSTPTFAKYNAELLDFDLPGCNQHEFNTDDYWTCNFRHLTTTTGTQAGSCKMGALEDHDTVVDSKMNVKGVNGLRVIDPSVIPLIGTGNYYAYAAMIGEKGADVIKEDWKFTV